MAPFAYQKSKLSNSREIYQRLELIPDKNLSVIEVSLRKSLGIKTWISKLSARLSQEKNWRR